MLSDVLIGINLRTQTQQNMNLRRKRVGNAAVQLLFRQLLQRLRNQPLAMLLCPFLPGFPHQAAKTQACAMPAVPHHLL